MTILAIDPGSSESAFVEYDFRRDNLVEFDKVANDVLLQRLRNLSPSITTIVCEWMQPRGMPTSAQEMETMYFVGRFAEAAFMDPSLRFERITRLRVKTHICGKSNANDANVRAALIDRYGGTGGKRRAIGLKASQGPLYGVTGDVWAALAVAVTYSETAT